MTLTIFETTLDNYYYIAIFSFRRNIFFYDVVFLFSLLQAISCAKISRSVSRAIRDRKTRLCTIHFTVHDGIMGSNEVSRGFFRGTSSGGRIARRFLPVHVKSNRILIEYKQSGGRQQKNSLMGIWRRLSLSLSLCISFIQSSRGCLPSSRHLLFHLFCLYTFPRSIFQALIRYD